MRLFVLVGLFVLSTVASAQTSACAGSLPNSKSKCDSGIALVTDSTSLPVTTVNANEIVVRYINRFHYGFGTQTQSSNVAAPAVPTALAPSTASFQGTIPASTSVDTGDVKVSPGQPPPPGDLSYCQTSSPWPSTWSDADDAIQVNACWGQQLLTVLTATTNAKTLRNAINLDIANAALEQHCYVQKLRYFGSPLLSYPMATELMAFAQANATTGANSCLQSYDSSWPLAGAATIDGTLLQVQNNLAQLASRPGYATWIKDPQNSLNNTALTTLINTVMAEVESYGNVLGGQAANATVATVQAQFQSTVDSNAFWRSVLESIAKSAPPTGHPLTDPASDDTASSFRYDVAINCKNNWYGRGRTDTVTLLVTDISATPSTTQNVILASNTCNPSAVVSTGVGITLLASPVFAFVPNASGAQVIGETSTNKISPLYALLYNVSIHEPAKFPFGFFASPGVALTSTSSSATADFLAGLSISFARRLIFLTGSADFGRRDTLMPGFSEGAPMGTLTTVPTRTDWKTGAMISISFSIAQ